MCDSSLDLEGADTGTTWKSESERVKAPLSANEKERMERMKKLKEMERKREEEKMRVLKQVCVVAHGT